MAGIEVLTEGWTNEEYREVFGDCRHLRVLTELPEGGFAGGIYCEDCGARV